MNKFHFLWCVWISSSLILIFLFAAGVGPVSAHANLVSSDPPHGAALAQTPPAITLEFSETVDLPFSHLRLLTANMQLIRDSAEGMRSETANSLSMPIPPLPNGVYSLEWKVRSKVDGHVTNGVVSFSVGVANPNISLLPPLGTPDPATALPRPAEVILRALGYLSAFLLTGGLIFKILIWQSSNSESAGSVSGADEQFLGFIKKLLWIGSGGLCLATIASFFYQASQASDAPLWQSTSQLAVDRTGILLVLRLVFVAILIAIIRRLPHPGISKKGWWGAAALSLGILLTFTLLSHAAASGVLIAMAFDWLHLASVSAWVGGLPVLAWLLWSRSYSDVQPLQELVRRFSRLAILSVICLCLTGIYTSLRQVGTLVALLATSYGFTLLVKLGLFGILVALGAVNLLVLSPRLSRSESPVALHWLNRTVRIETFLSALVLVAAAGLSSTPPAREALQAQQRLGIVEGARANGVKLTLRVSPALAGDNELGVDIIDRRPGADQAPATVLYRFKMLDHEMGETQVEASSPNGLRYTARGSYLSMVGRWQVAVILRRSGMDDVRHDFELDIQSASPEVVGPPNPFPPTPDSIAAGQLLFQANCQPCHGPGGRGDGPVGLTLNPRPVDLTLHTVPGIHTDGQLFLWISDGYPGSQMPAFRSALSDEQRWHVVNFIRTLTGRPVP